MREIDYPDGRLAIRYDGIDLPYRTFDKRPQVNQAAIVETKRLGLNLAYIAEQQKQLDMSRSAKAPRAGAARRTVCSRSDRSDEPPGRCVAQCEGFTRRPLEKQTSTPNPQRGSYPAPRRVTTLTGANRDFPKWRRHGRFRENKNIVPSYDSELVRLSILDATRSCSSRLPRTPKQIASEAVHEQMLGEVTDASLWSMSQQK